MLYVYSLHVFHRKHLSHYLTFNHVSHRVCDHAQGVQLKTVKQDTHRKPSAYKHIGKYNVYGNRKSVYLTSKQTNAQNQTKK